MIFTITILTNICSSLRQTSPLPNDKDVVRVRSFRTNCFYVDKKKYDDTIFAPSYVSNVDCEIKEKYMNLGSDKYSNLEFSKIRAFNALFNMKNIGSLNQFNFLENSIVLYNSELRKLTNQAKYNKKPYAELDFALWELREFTLKDIDSSLLCREISYFALSIIQNLGDTLSQEASAPREIQQIDFFSFLNEFLYKKVLGTVPTTFEMIDLQGCLSKLQFSVFLAIKDFNIDFNSKYDASFSIEVLNVLKNLRNSLKNSIRKYYKSLEGLGISDRTIGDCISKNDESRDLIFLYIAYLKEIICLIDLDERSKRSILKYRRASKVLLFRLVCVLFKLNSEDKCEELISNLSQDKLKWWNNIHKSGQIRISSRLYGEFNEFGFEKMLKRAFESEILHAKKHEGRLESKIEKIGLKYENIEKLLGIDIEVSKSIKDHLKKIKRTNIFRYLWE